jgi:hypothetical protein
MWFSISFLARFSFCFSSALCNSDFWLSTFFPLQNTNESSADRVVSYSHNYIFWLNISSLWRFCLSLLSLTGLGGFRGMISPSSVSPAGGGWCVGPLWLSGIIATEDSSETTTVSTLPNSQLSNSRTISLTIARRDAATATDSVQGWIFIGLREVKSGSTKSMLTCFYTVQLRLQLLDGVLGVDRLLFFRCQILQTKDSQLICHQDRQRCDNGCSTRVKSSPRVTLSHESAIPKQFR